jgi:uncharacterized protein YceK
MIPLKKRVQTDLIRLTARIAICAIPLLMATMLQGCSTIMSQSGAIKSYTSLREPKPSEQTISHVYSGVQFDGLAIVGAFRDDPIPRYTSTGRLALGTLAVMDMPLSLLMDSVLLPLTVYRQLDRGNIILCDTTYRCRRRMGVPEDKHHGL